MLWIYAIFWYLPSTRGIHLQLEEERPREFCQWEMFNVSCPPNEFILITSARYGRMQVGRCVPVNYFIGCSVDVHEQMNTLCSGRKHCSVTISNRDLFRVQPCRKDLVAYLEAGYRCVPVSGLSSIDSQSSPICDGRAIVTRDRTGYFTSSITRLSGLGSERCPWLIEAKRGQRIRLTLRDLSYSRYSDTESGQKQSGSTTGLSNEQCPVVLELYENHPEPVRDKVQSCVIKEQRVLSHTSATNRLYIVVHLNTSSSPDVRFYLHYELIGCPDVVAPSNAWMKRDGDRLLVTCNFTRERWHIVCNGQEWISAINNCSTPGTAIEIRNLNNKLQQTKSFPFGLLIAVPVGIVIGIAIGFLFLLLICFCRNRMYEKRDSNGDDPGRNVYKLLELRPNQDRGCPDLTPTGTGEKHDCPTPVLQSFPPGQGYLTGDVYWQYIGLCSNRREHWNSKGTAGRSQSPKSVEHGEICSLCAIERPERVYRTNSLVRTPPQRCTCSSGKCVHQCAPTVCPTSGLEARRHPSLPIAGVELIPRKLQMDVDDEEEEEERKERTAIESCQLEGDRVNQLRR